MNWENLNRIALAFLRLAFIRLMIPKALSAMTVPADRLESPGNWPGVAP